MTTVRAVAACMVIFASAGTHLLPAQSLESVAIVVGASRLPLTSAYSGGLNVATATLTVNVGVTRLWGAMLAGRVLGTTEGRASTPVCVPGGSCIEYKTPSTLLNVAGGAYLLTESRMLRTSLAGGLLTAAGLRGAANTSSPTIQAGLEYAPWPDRRVSPFIELHLLRTTRDIAGIRTLVLPSVGIAF